VDILRANGLPVEVIPTYESLFSMVARNRFDLFCRGANEVLEEYESHRHIEQLRVDRRFALVYPLPRFFYAHRNNRAALNRIHKGLTLAFEDGSLMALWRKEYQDSVVFSGLHHRRLFFLDNTRLKGLDPRYQRYNYNPLADTALQPGP